eukprot:6085180-Prymnesium_polylepis.1
MTGLHTSLRGADSNPINNLRLHHISASRTHTSRIPRCGRREQRSSADRLPPAGSSARCGLAELTASSTACSSGQCGKLR